MEYSQGKFGGPCLAWLLQVREDICTIHEGYQYFRLKYQSRYCGYTPGPDNFL